MISIENLVKRHGSREVLHGVSLEARPGRVTGFVGPNGAGKSSTLRCLLGLDRADGGRALIAATAIVHDLILVTHNTKDFERTGIRLLDPRRGE